MAYKYLCNLALAYLSPCHNHLKSINCPLRKFPLTPQSGLRMLLGILKNAVHIESEHVLPCTV